MFVGGNSGRETPGDPFRTRKLSLPALLVLHPGGCGRESYRRHENRQLLHTPKRGWETLRCLPSSLLSFCCSAWAGCIRIPDTPSHFLFTRGIYNVQIALC